jgi:hypothetical protein
MPLRSISRTSRRSQVKHLPPGPLGPAANSYIVQELPHGHADAYLVQPILVRPDGTWEPLGGPLECNDFSRLHQAAKVEGSSRTARALADEWHEAGAGTNDTPLHEGGLTNNTLANAQEPRVNGANTNGDGLPTLKGLSEKARQKVLRRRARGLPMIVRVGWSGAWGHLGHWALSPGQYEHMHRLREHRYPRIKVVLFGSDGKPAYEVNPWVVESYGRKIPSEGGGVARILDANELLREGLAAPCSPLTLEACR